MIIQQTLADEFELSGVGLHTGHLTKVRVLPALEGQGRYFVRADLPGLPVIPARLECVRQTMLSTELASGDASVRTVEHLLAALAAMGVDNARIELDGPEVPLLDGSAKLWVEAIASVGLVKVELGTGDWEQGTGDWGLGKRKEVRSQESGVRSGNSPFSLLPSPFSLLPSPQSPIPNPQSPLWVYQGDAFVAALPSAELRFSYAIDFDLPAIGQQWYSWAPAQTSFAAEIAPARTFGLAHQIEQLRSQGLIKGGSLDNALICGADGWINPPLRFPNEPVRHKILDLVGDMSLLGNFPAVHFIAYKASHNLHVQLARLMAQSNLGF